MKILEDSGVIELFSPITLTTFPNKSFIREKIHVIA